MYELHTHTHTLRRLHAVFSLDLSPKLKAISLANKLKANCKLSPQKTNCNISASFCRWASRAATTAAAAREAALPRLDPTLKRCAGPAMSDSAATAAIRQVRQCSNKQSEPFNARNSIINRNLLLFSILPLPGAYCAGTFDGWLCWPDTAAGTSAYELCPDFITGFEPTSKFWSPIFASLLNSSRVSLLQLTGLWELGTHTVYHTISYTHA